MKKITQISLGLVAMSMMALFTACPDGGTGTPECKDTEKLNEISGTCIATCTDAEGCTDETMPACVLDTTDNAFALVKDICGCLPDSCADDEVCHPTGNVCVKACDDTTECPTVGTDTYLCYDNEVADAKVCQAPCEKSEDCGDGKYSVCYTTGDDAGKCKEACEIGGSDCGTGFTCGTDGMCFSSTGGCDGDFGGTGDNLCSETKPVCDAEGICQDGQTNESCVVETPPALLDGHKCVAIADAPSSKCAATAETTYGVGMPVIYNVAEKNAGTCGDGSRTKIEITASIYAPDTTEGNDFIADSSLFKNFLILNETGAGVRVASSDDFKPELILDRTYTVSTFICMADLTLSRAIVYSEYTHPGGATVGLIPAGTKTTNAYCLDFAQ